MVLGVPYDRTSTYRPGSKFGPSAIREASANIETYSIRSGMDVEDLGICDIGDMNVTDNPAETIERIRLIVGEIVSDGKTPVMLGGEHTITLGGVKALGTSTTVVGFDAHMDLRNEYNGEALSHAAVMRRITERIGPSHVLLIGTRAICKEELQFAEANSVTRISSLELQRKPVEKSLETLKKKLSGCQSIYLTIDADVIDPAYAPAVGNPEADGLTPSIIMTLLEEICTQNVVAIDLTEVSPHYDTGATAAQATKILFESLCYVERRKRQTGKQSRENATDLARL